MKIKIINNSSLQIFILLAVALLLFGVQGISAQSITGPPSVAVGDEEGYTLSGASATSWAVPAGTQILSQTSSTVVVRFNTAGSSFVRALHNVGPGFTVLNITVTGGPPPTPNNPTVLSNSCGSSTLQRTSNPGSGISWFWQGKNAFGTNMSSGNNAVNNNYVANQGSGRYYIRARQNGQWSTNSGFVDVTITETPTAPTVNTVPPSCGGVVTLSVSNPDSAYDYRWYNASGSAWIGTGTSFTTDPLTSSIDFLVRAVTKSPNPICVSPASTVSVTVSSPPKPAGNQTVTSTCNSPDIELTASNTTFPDNSTEIEHRWYFTAGGTGAGSYILGTPVPGAGFRTKIVVSGITQDTTYWVAAVVDGCESERHPITADYEENIEPTLAVINITGPQCGPSANFTLNATVVGGNANFSWYDAE
ncbi:MAG: hypothetical protein ABJN95_15915, partial [Maribacter sp.]|uniref:immunoglobulin domain-containing protein n=1 Tax=Maribacter sp. TaxID=1897614 RepID=UPI003298D9D0